jgi:two-component system, NarL family, response regulator NreC
LLEGIQDLMPEAKTMHRYYSIVLADAHTRFRREMKKILEERPDIKVLGEAGCRGELFALLAQGQPEMVILDLAMPDLRAREGAQLIKSQYPGIKILIMVMDQGKEYLSYGLSSGAEGVLPKQYLAGHIFQAIATIQQGRVYVPIHGTDSQPKDLSQARQVSSNLG